MLPAFGRAQAVTDEGAESVGYQVVLFKNNLVPGV
jgi:hypothetical protein